MKKRGERWRDEKRGGINIKFLPLQRGGALIGEGRGRLVGEGGGLIEDFFSCWLLMFCCAADC